MKRRCCVLMIEVALLVSFCSMNGIALADESTFGDGVVRFFHRIIGWDVVDGPGMEYEWTKYDLQTRWVEITDASDPFLLYITDSVCSITDSSGDEIETIAYSLPDGVNGYTHIEDEVYLQLKGSIFYDQLVFHYETVGEKTIPILSATAIELDGRGEIVLAEFVAEENFDALPDGFRSAFCISRNDSYAPPMYIPPMKDAPEEGDLIFGESFYAQIVCNRYGSSSSEDEYAHGRFLLWAEPLVQTEEGDFVRKGDDAAIPYIVSDNGNDVNLSMLSGGWDGLYPYGDSILLLTTDKAGEIVDAIFCK